MEIAMNRRRVVVDDYLDIVEQICSLISSSINEMIPRDESYRSIDEEIKAVKVVESLKWARA